MTTATQHLLDSFNLLSVAEKQTVACESCDAYGISTFRHSQMRISC